MNKNKLDRVERKIESLVKKAVVLNEAADELMKHDVMPWDAEDLAAKAESYFNWAKRLAKSDERLLGWVGEIAAQRS